MTYPSTNSIIDSLANILSTKLSFQNPCSTQKPVISNACQPLSLEIWVIVAKHLSKHDLNTLCQVSHQCKAAALVAKNIQEMHSAVKELQILGNLNPQNPIRVSSPVDFYQKFVAFIRRPIFLDVYDGVEIQPEQVARLQKRLTTLFTKVVVFKFLKLSQDCYKQINKNKASIQIIEQRYFIKKTAFVLRALDLLIRSTRDPELTKSWVLQTASRHGVLEIVLPILKSREALLAYRTESVYEASIHGHVRVLQSLLERENITDDERGRFVTHAAENGHLDTVSCLLEHGNISQLFRGNALMEAAKKGHLEVVKKLHQNGPISAKLQYSSLKHALKGRHFKIAGFLLMNPILTTSDCVIC